MGRASRRAEGALGVIGGDTATSLNSEIMCNNIDTMLTLRGSPRTPTTGCRARERKTWLVPGVWPGVQQKRLKRRGVPRGGGGGDCQALTRWRNNDVGGGRNWHSFLRCSRRLPSFVLVVRVGVSFARPTTKERTCAEHPADKKETTNRAQRADCRIRHQSEPLPPTYRIKCGIHLAGWALPLFFEHLRPA